MEEVDPIGDGVFDDHPLGIALDGFGSGSGKLVRQEEVGFLVAKINNHHLPQWSGAILTSNLVVQHLGGSCRCEIPLRSQWASKQIEAIGAFVEPMQNE